MEYYTQTTPNTGAAACMLTLLHHHHPQTYPLTREQEYRLWQQSANLPTRQNSIFALATIAAKEGLQATIITTDTEYDYPDYRFKRYTKQDMEQAAYTSNIHKQEALAAGVKITEKDFTQTDIDEQLRNGAHILLRVNIGALTEEKSLSRYILVINKQGTQYHVLDPRTGPSTIQEDTLNKALETLVSKKKREHRMLVIKKQD